MMRNKLILSIIILIIVLVSLGIWFYQRNSYSKADFSLEISAPRETTLAQEIEYTIIYKNNGEFKLEEPVLIFQFPEHSIVEDGQGLRREMPLETIYPRQEGQLKLKARLMGKKDEVKEARAWLNYRPQNLASQNIADTSFSTKIVSVPIELTSDLPSKIEAGKEITFRFNYFYNTDYPLSNLGIKIDHPSDFNFERFDLTFETRLMDTPLFPYVGVSLGYAKYEEKDIQAKNAIYVVTSDNVTPKDNIEISGPSYGITIGLMYEWGDRFSAGIAYEHTEVHDREIVYFDGVKESFELEAIETLKAHISYRFP